MRRSFSPECREPMREAPGPKTGTDLEAFPGNAILPNGAFSFFSFLSFLSFL
jgi:hypothetical protein